MLRPSFLSFEKGIHLFSLKKSFAFFFLSGNSVPPLPEFPLVVEVRLLADPALLHSPFFGGRKEMTVSDRRKLTETIDSIRRTKIVSSGPGSQIVTLRHKERKIRKICPRAKAFRDSRNLTEK